MIHGWGQTVAATGPSPDRAATRSAGSGLAGRTAAGVEPLPRTGPGRAPRHRRSRTAASTGGAAPRWAFRQELTCGRRRRPAPRGTLPRRADVGDRTGHRTASHRIAPPTDPFGDVIGSHRWFDVAALLGPRHRQEGLARSGCLAGGPTPSRWLSAARAKSYGAAVTAAGGRVTLAQRSAGATHRSRSRRRVRGASDQGVGRGRRRRASTRGRSCGEGVQVTTLCSGLSASWSTTWWSVNSPSSG